MTNSNLADLQKKIKDYENLLKEVNSDLQALIKKKQYMEICNLSQSQLTFAELAKLLNIKEDDVEEWVLEAISEDLVVAQID